MTLISNTLAIAANQQLQFQAIGGVEPYVYSVTAGGIGGTINASTGLYTAPSNLGNDIIVATDDNGDTVEQEILVASPLGLFCDIIQKEMALADGQVYIWDQKYNTPKDSRLYVVIAVLSEKPFGNSNQLDANGNSVQTVNINATLSVSIQSRGPEARSRKEEIILALNSNYAQSQQETNSFYVGKLSGTFVNLSLEDGPAIPYQFNISVQMQYFVKKVKAVPYFDTFEEPEITIDN